MSNRKVEYSGGVGLGTILFIVFLVLKLVGVIAWSWWWVTAPIWIPFLVVIAILIISFIIGVTVTLAD